jgi:hypothetical protein
MAIEIPNSLLAYGTVNSDGTKASGAGFASAKTGAGVYTLTLDQPAPAAGSSLLLTIKGAGGGKSEIEYTDTSDTVKGVTTWDAGVAADHAFSFLSLRAPG